MVRDGRREGKHFKHEEAMWLAEAWVRQSLKGPNQKEEGMWEEIADHLRKEHGTTRSLNSLRTKWSTLAHDVQCYLAARNHVMQRPPSGQTQEGLDKIVMQLYCSRNKRVDAEGIERHATPFKYVSVADFLERYPKFGGLAVEGTRSETERGRKRSGAVVLGSDEDGGGRSSAGRPRGIKATKREEYRKQREDVMTERLGSISDGLERSSAALERIATTQEKGTEQDGDFMLLQVLPRGSPEYNAVLQRFMARQNTQQAGEEQPDGGDAIHTTEAAGQVGGASRQVGGTTGTDGAPF